MRKVLRMYENVSSNRTSIKKQNLLKKEPDRNFGVEKYNN